MLSSDEQPTGSSMCRMLYPGHHKVSTDFIMVHNFVQRWNIWIEMESKNEEHKVYMSFRVCLTEGKLVERQ